MANTWNCDICGVRTFMNPASEPAFVQDGTKLVPKIDEKTGKPLVKIVDGFPEILTEEVPNLIPLFETMRRQNLHNGTTEEIEVQKLEYLEEPAIMVKLKIGPENIQRDFCRECLEKYCGTEVRALRDKLWTVEGK